MKINITAADFENYGILAKHCDWQKLTISIQEALDFDLLPVFKDCSISVKKLLFKVLNYKEGDENKPTEKEIELINGIIFSHKNQDFENLGLKRGLIYYAYGRYVIINGLNDSASGMVTATNSFSIPKSQNELEVISNKYRNLGFVSFESCFEFVALHRDNFESLKCLKLDNCYCYSDRHQKNINTKGFGFSGGIVNRY